jgi:hypothetical protein
LDRSVASAIASPAPSVRHALCIHRQRNVFVIPPVAVGQAGGVSQVVTFGIPGHLQLLYGVLARQNVVCAVFVLSDVCIAAIRAAFCVAIAA